MNEESWWYSEHMEEAAPSMLVPRRPKGRCAFCKGINVHSTLCRKMTDSWKVMPWGKHKGSPVRVVDTDYLEFVLSKRYGTRDHRRMFLEELQSREPSKYGVTWEGYLEELK